ncbi:MAG: prolyl oligopeptidase family serine peptidase [Candidatus Eisenbacteria bacterium]|nr:prolyl oligopeptidase family serine peptidase [Candidatus Eisenbacteria bacterium]
MRTLDVCPLLLLVCLLLPSRALAAPPDTVFVARAARIGAQAYPYRVYVPPGFDAAKRWPVVLFLHGSGERGSDGERQVKIGLGPAIRRNPGRFPLLAVFPQAPDDSSWLGEPGRAALAALDSAMAEFSGDPARVYLTGLSMGGYGCWHLAWEDTTRWAAVVSVCGGLVPPDDKHSVRLAPELMAADDPYAAVAARVAALPAWLFHGARDPIIPVGESRRIVAALQARAADVKYTEYAAAGHDCWDRAFGEEDLWTWLLGKRREAAK